MAKLDFPDASYSPWIAPNNVIYTYIGTSPNGFWEANTASASSNLTAIFVERAGSTMTGALKLDNAGNVSLPDISFDTDVNTGIYSPGADSLAITTGGTQRVTVDSLGRVGVGVSAPSNALDIGSGNIEMGGGNNTALTWSSDVSSHYLKFTSAINGLTLNGYGGLAFETNGANERMRIDASGNVFIGGTTASSADIALNANGSATFVGTVTANAFSGDGSALTNLPSGYTNSDVDSHLNTSTAASNEVLSWNGSDYDWVAQSGGGGSPFSTDIVVNSLTVGRGAGNVSSNTAFGDGTLGVSTSGANNVGVGKSALSSLTSGNNCTAIGTNALRAQTGSDTVAVGKSSLYNSTTGQQNVAMGGNALYNSTTGTNNTAIGYTAGDNITTGSNNILLGNGADASAATVSNEITLGNTSINSLRIPGLQSGASDGDVLTYNSSTGKITLAAAGGGGGGATSIDGLSDAVTYDGGLSIGLGTNALTNDDGTDNNNTALGYNALNANTSAHDNTAVGFDAGKYITTGNYNTLFGAQAGDRLTTGQRNTLVGMDSGSGIITASDNTLIGYHAGRNIAGDGNIVLGSGAVSNTSYPTNCVAMGNNALFMGGTLCTAIGHEAGRSGSTGANQSSYLGARSGYNNEGDDNVFVGYKAGYLLTTADDCVLIGSLAGYDITTGSNNIVIGNSAAASSATVSNEITLGDASISSLRIPGLQSGASDGDVLTYSSSTGKITLASAGGGGGGGAMEYISTTTISGTTAQVEFDLSSANYDFFIVKAYGCKFTAAPSNGYCVYFSFYDGTYNSGSPATNKLNYKYQRSQRDGSSLTTSSSYSQNLTLFLSWTPDTSTQFGFNAEVGGKTDSPVYITSNFIKGTSTSSGAPSIDGVAPNSSNNITYMIVKPSTTTFAAGKFLLYGVKNS